jgi:YesN/AraC family two-component response regulator
MHCYAVNFILQDLQGRDATLPFPLVSHVGYQKDIINLYEEMVAIWEEKRPGYLIRTRALFSLILCRFFELISSDTAAESTGDARIRRITHYITTHYAEKFTVKHLAAQMSLNTAYFGTLFKQNTGVTLNQFVIRTRIRAAVEMLKIGDRKVSEIAEHCGYSDVFHFYKQFKKVIGIKPSQFLPKKNG